MARTKLADRKLPDYTRGEEILNSSSHALGVAFGIAVLILCIVFSVKNSNPWGIAAGAIYGTMMIALYAVSSVYHGLVPKRAKLVFQVLDHCSIYALIFGTYVPILFMGIREYDVSLFVGILIYVLVGIAIGVFFTAVDFKRYAPVSMSCYFVVGWSALFLIKPIVSVLGARLFIWLLIGGAAYTLGMIFFKKGITKKYYHSVFHFFILAGSVLQFVGIFKYCFIAR
ncbi:MAG: hemolysin III family protein [Clostridia bacterium]|nr:hemolysin III family protein [Clostridia bacterium]